MAAVNTTLAKMLQWASRFGQHGAELAKAIYSGGIYGGVLPAVKVADYTVLASENGQTFFTGTGAVNFTLPTIAAGLSYTFVNLVDANMTITTNALGIHKGSVTAAAVAFSTASAKMGSIARVVAVPTAASDSVPVLKWLVINSGGTTATVS